MIVSEPLCVGILDAFHGVLTQPHNLFGLRFCSLGYALLLEVALDAAAAASILRHH
jgi:hypothetical protein